MPLRKSPSSYTTNQLLAILENPNNRKDTVQSAVRELVRRRSSGERMPQGRPRWTGRNMRNMDGSMRTSMQRNVSRAQSTRYKQRQNRMRRLRDSNRRGKSW